MNGVSGIRERCPLFLLVTRLGMTCSEAPAVLAYPAAVVLAPVSEAS